MKPSVHVVARLTALPDRVADLRAVLVGLVEPTRRESGCITYELCQNPADETEFTFLEEWTSDAALDAHFKTDHFLDAVARIPDLVLSSPDIRRYTRIA